MNSESEFLTIFEFIYALACCITPEGTACGMPRLLRVTDCDWQELDNILNSDSFMISIGTQEIRENFKSKSVNLLYILNENLTPEIVSIENVSQTFLLPIHSKAFFDKVVHYSYIVFLTR